MDERDLTFKKIREMERGLFGIGEQKELDYD
jgi:hypothetical protein